MRSQIRLVPLDELILPPQRDTAEPSPSVRLPASGRAPFPQVIITPDHHVIAGRASLRAYEISGHREIPCRVTDGEDLDILLTGFHNTILYSELPGPELSLLLDSYADLCRYRQSKTDALSERLSALRTRPDREEGTPDERGGADREHLAGTPDPERPSELPVDDRASLPGWHPATDRRRPDPFRFF
jgi:hypothetical protein